MTKPHILRCPKPSVWADVHRRLLEVHRTRDLSKEDFPPKALILNGWLFSSVIDKHERWLETVEWARGHSCAQIVSSLSDRDFIIWEHDAPGWSPEFFETYEE